MPTRDAMLSLSASACKRSRAPPTCLITAPGQATARFVRYAGSLKDELPLAPKTVR